MDFAKAEDLPMVVRTLIANRFVLDGVHRKPTYILFECHREDEFGVTQRYVFSFYDRPLDSNSTKAINNHVSRVGARVVFVGEPAPEGVIALSWSRFLGRLGGPVKSWLPLDPTFRQDLVTLGHDQALPSVAGRPDDLFEEYVQVGLQLLLADRVIRYGQGRRGEVLPDGIAFGRSDMLLMYDAKAYRDGYPVTRGTIRQFADYVNAFHRKYEHYGFQVFAFLVISGQFKGSEKTLGNRSRELYSECRAPLVFMTADDLGAGTQRLAQQPSLRASIDWKKVFSNVNVTHATMEGVIDATIRDGIVR